MVELEVAVHDLLDKGGAPDLALQPIVDLRRGQVVGYEVLSRFSGPPVASPDRWFAAARRVRRAVELESRVIFRALELRPVLPDNCFLSVNVAPSALLDGRLQDWLRGQSLSRIVFELTEHTAVGDYTVLSHAIREVRELGAFVAVDDAGAGYSSLAHILELRPDIVKLDRSLISGIQNDDAKAALVEMFGAFTGRIDSWLLAEGIEEHEELTRLLQLGIPLGQGYLLGRPQPVVTDVDASLAARIQAAVPREEVLTVARFVECVESRVRSTGSPSESGVRLVNRHLPWRVELDEQLRPRGLVFTRQPNAEPRQPLCILEATSALDAVKRALTRPEATRFDPLVCCDESGAYVGLVRLERLLEQLLFPPEDKPSYRSLPHISLSPSSLPPGA